ncbi:18486_t:CDS:2, partial [Funneliformis geosporum]
NGFNQMRYKAHLMGTTYAYDFSELFRQAISILWNRASQTLNILQPNWQDHWEYLEYTCQQILVQGFDWLKKLLIILTFAWIDKGNPNKEIVEEGETRHKITNIIGSKDGLGVECLKGIGAYLVRLGQRTIQNEGQLIILTRAPALNKVLRREVYTGNLQLGDYAMASYVPAVRNSPVPRFMNSGTWDRDVNYMPPKGPYDPRWLIAGKYEIERDPKSWWMAEDRCSRTRTSWWNSSGCYSRTVESIVPADPANSGQVCHLNSAYKTAQAINDFNKGEQLPLMIFANWRGFSGELRGGAWVVIDPTINDDMIEMYADAKSRADVLEPQGIVEIKFRKSQLLATRKRFNLQILHDTPGRMKSIETIRTSLELKESRRFFYWRVRRRIIILKAIIMKESDEEIVKWFEKTLDDGSDRFE